MFRAGAGFPGATFLNIPRREAPFAQIFAPLQAEKPCRGGFVGASDSPPKNGVLVFMASLML